jgi:hypothetical protein
MPDDPTEEIIKREVAEAARILREDGYSVRLGVIEAKLNKHFPDEPPADDKDDPNGPPKPPDPKDPTAPPAKKSGIWWGDATADE